MATLGAHLVLFGGTSIDSYGSPGPASQDTYVFDGTEWTEVAVTTGPPARIDTSMVNLGNRVVLFGGTAMDGGGPEFSDTWTFVGTTWTPVPVSNAPSPRWGPAMATLGDRVILFGGASSLQETTFDDTWTFDGTTWTQLSVSSAPPSRAWGSMATLGDRVVLFGVTTTRKRFWPTPGRSIDRRGRQ
jgi:hypothetical protein